MKNGKTRQLLMSRRVRTVGPLVITTIAGLIAYFRGVIGAPDLRDLMIATAILGGIALLRRFWLWLATSAFGKRRKSGAVDWFDARWTDFFQPIFTGTDMIRWLTKGRINVDVCCHEVRRKRIRGFRGETCPRTLCHFGPEWNNGPMPMILAMWMPWRARRRRYVYLASVRPQGKAASLSPRGELIGWTANGLTFLLDGACWNWRKKGLEKVAIPCFVYVELWRFPPVTARLLVKVRELRQDNSPKMATAPGAVKILATFEDRFIPSQFRPAKRCITIPVCVAWEIQGERPPGCQYAMGAPQRLRDLQRQASGIS
ncbi:MAG: hypothetical protein FJ279_09065 [Planctomycetes bacterium]|nr:hypothetical protein [Planctomycetota bacterium]